MQSSKESSIIIVNNNNPNRRGLISIDLSGKPNNSGKRKKLDDDGGAEAEAETAGDGREDVQLNNNDIIIMSGRERQKRHWAEIAGRGVCIPPDIWGHEVFLKDWIHCTAFEASLVSTARLMSARASLVVEQGRRRTPAAAAITIGDGSLAS